MRVVVDEGGDPACWLDRVCEECGAIVVTGPHRCPPTVSPVTRVIVGFSQDPCGDWVAHLSCHHRQHVRHQPPFQLRPWVLTAETRAAHVGTSIDCRPCAQAEIPEGLTVARTAGPFDAASIPSGLLKDHIVSEGTWGRVNVIEGTITCSLMTDPPAAVRLGPGDTQAIPPGVPHSLSVRGPVLLTVDFLNSTPPGPDRRSPAANPD